MKFGADDFNKVRTSLLAAVVMILIGGLTVYYTADSRRQARLAQTTSAKRLAEADAKLKQVSIEENEVKQKSQTFRQLQERGIIGEEQRLEWVELLKDIRANRRLLDLEYEISPQRMLEGTNTGEYSFYASAMKLQIKLLHEEDLDRLLNDLRSQAKALIMVRSCHVSRLPTRSEEHANLQADCEIDWVTLREGSKK
ncbi:MAG TPA: hypothetical protein PKN13_02985 [Accumulibacter sp.]|nr:hypothetical protein [Accumulibacter sp.]HMW18834.1 hypothetical protein [Accumulibacter sp.]HMX23228.1 hypothetical protein [Accumulibacter sp.]HMY06481.1 hypothetical protein [Accumulibacter sp.]HNC16988.1 hypothetical protein [Accumulibacter sp.]